MAMIEVEVWDVTGSRRQPASVPDDAPVNRIVVVLTERMSLPRTSPDGMLMSYKLHHKRAGKQLLDSETLRDAGVEAGDVLRILPEITAGRSS
jgi:hypothetical protein